MNTQIENILSNTTDSSAYIIRANQLRNEFILKSITGLAKKIKEAFSTLNPTWLASPQAA